MAGSNTYNTAGNGTWTAPANVGNVTIEVWGGGGGGGGSNVNLQGNTGGGGGGGAYARITILYPGLAGGNTFNFTVGAGGTGGVGNANGTDGGQTIFYNNTGGNTDVIIAANGGSKGLAGNVAGNRAGAGGAANTAPGVTSYAGGYGSNAGSSNYGGGGGAGAGNANPGNNGTGSGTGSGGVGSNGGGNGGNGGARNANGNNGSIAGGGGGGAGRANTTTGTNRVGGKGANGQIIITWDDAPSYQPIYPSSIDSAESVSSPTILPGAVTLQPTSISSSESVSSPKAGNKKYVFILGDSAMVVNASPYYSSVAEFIQQYFGLFPETNPIIEVVIAAVGGARMSGGTVKTIPQQYSDSVATYGVPEVVIFDGGLNDIKDECSNPSSSPPCDSTFWNQLWNDFASLFDDMVADGVKKVFYGGPYHLRGDLAVYNSAIDYFWENYISQFQSNWPELNFAILDPREFFDAHQELMAIDDVHTTSYGSVALADLAAREIPGGWIDPGGTWRLRKAIPLMMVSHAQAVNTNYVDATYPSGVSKWLYNEDDYDGDVFFVLEVDAYTNNLNDNASIALFDITAQGTVSQSAVKVYNTTSDVGQIHRSAPFFKSNLANGHEYRFRLRSGSVLTTIYVKRVTLYVYQKGNITNTATEFALLSCGSQDLMPSTTSTSYVESVGTNCDTSKFKFNSSDFDGTVSIYFEANIYTSGSSYTGYAALFDQDGNQVSGSEVSVTGTVLTRVRSSAITLTDGYVYHPRVKTSGGTAYFADIRLIIKQSNFTKTISFQSFCAGPSNATQTTPARISSSCSVPAKSWLVPSSNDFIGIGGTLKVSADGYTAYLSLDDSYGSAEEIISTTSTQKVYVESSSSQADILPGVRYYTYAYSSDSNATATVVRSLLVYRTNFPKIVSDAEGISSAENFGSVSIEVFGGALQIQPTSISTSESMSTPTINVGLTSIQPASISSSESVSSPFINVGSTSIQPSSISTSESVSNPVVNVGLILIQPASILTSETISTPIINVRSVLIQSASIPTSESVSSPFINVGSTSIQPASISTSESVSNPIVSVGSTSIQPASIQTSELFGSLIVSSGEIFVQNAGGISSLEFISAPTINVGLISIQPSSIPTAESMSSPTINVGSVLVQPISILTLESVSNPIVNIGSISIQPISILTSESISNPTVNVGSVSVQPTSIQSLEEVGDSSVFSALSIIASGISSAESVANPLLQTGIVSVYPSSINSSEFVSYPIVSAGLVSIKNVGEIESQEQFGSADISIGSVIISVPSVGPGENFGVPAFGFGSVFVNPIAIESEENVSLNASVAVGASAIHDVGGIETSEIFGSPEVSVGSYTIFAEGIKSAEIVPANALIGRSLLFQKQPCYVDMTEKISQIMIANPALELYPSISEKYRVRLSLDPNAV